MKNKKSKRKISSKKLLPTIESHLRKNLSGLNLTLALQNTLPVRKQIRVEKFSQALFQAFQFGDTAQGFDYWNSIFQYALKNENAC